MGTLLPLLHSLTWTPPPYCRAPLLSWVSTPPSTPSIPPPVSWTPTSSAKSTTKSHVVYKRSSKITNLSRILLPFWVWTSCLRKTNSQSHALARSNVSFHNLSKSPRCLQVTLASLSPWNRPFLASPKFSLANTITCLRSHSIWSETFQRSLPRQNDWLPRPTKFTAAISCCAFTINSLAKQHPIFTTAHKVH